ncbi:MAG: hypothetical protein GWO02_19645, partial [Gammaproteobacteria bacterium]|nr:hypothetical protein [Gammaproteobacteria bacterium]
MDALRRAGLQLGCAALLCCVHAAHAAPEAKGSAPPLTAFPGAVGFGAEAVGGRGGDVYHVTTLADAGPGSLREAIASADGPRTVVFEVGGTIDLASPLTVRTSRLTLAGQTAPGGIGLRGYPLQIVDATDVIVRYLRVRTSDIHARGLPGKPGNGNGDLPGDAGDA